MPKANLFFDKQIQQGTFEYTLNYLIDSELDLSIFDGRFRKDETGAPAMIHVLCYDEN
jgi:hypothetical protein